MSQQELTHYHSRRLSLSARVSLFLMLATILPLITTVAISELLSRPALISQANLAMVRDARTSVQLIDTYFTERYLDTETLSQVPSLQLFMASPPGNSDLATHALYALAAGRFRDPRYTIWSLFDLKGHLRLSFPTGNQPQPHGQYLIPQEDLNAVTTGRMHFSPVYFDPITQKASIDIYTPVIPLSSPTTLLGFVRATLNIDYIWDIVKNDTGANGSGSYAFILDQNGVRIADSDPSRRFSAIAPLSEQALQLITSESRYGTSRAVPIVTDKILASELLNAHASSTFQLTPARQSDAFQAARQTSSVVPWNYFVFSPLNTVAAVANQQLIYTSIFAFAVLLLAAILGWIIGQHITRPILRSVDYLRGNSETLNTLATKQQSAATEQTWVVDSSHIGLQSVQYYTDATKVAAHRLGEIGTDLAHNWHQLDVQTAKAALGQMVTIARYIENATYYQTSSNRKLATAIMVTTQVTEQLATGATSAADASVQMEHVVNELRDVVGS